MFGGLWAKMGTPFFVSTNPASKRPGRDPLKRLQPTWSNILKYRSQIGEEVYGFERESMGAVVGGEEPVIAVGAPINFQGAPVGFDQDKFPK